MFTPISKMIGQISFLACVLAVCAENTNYVDNSVSDDDTRYVCVEPRYITTQATAVLIGDKSDVSGTIQFDQSDTGSAVKVSGALTGLPQGIHGFHIHELGTIKNGCDGAGEHFNPDGVEHGAPTDPVHHAGDLGNVKANGKGMAIVSISSESFSLNGDRSVIGRTIVIHADQDDYGKSDSADSKTTGHSGGRIACGVIGISKEEFHE